MNTLLRDVFARNIKSGRTKPRVLVFAFDFLSHYLRCLQLAERCHGEVEFIFGHSRRYERWLTEAAVPTFAFDDTDAELILEYSTRFDFSWMNEPELERVFKQQIEIIERYQPDVVLGDASMTLNMAAEYCGVPCVKLVNGYMSKYYAQHRPLPRIHPLHSLFQYLPARIQQAATWIGERAVMWWTHRAFARLRKTYSLKRKYSFLDELEGQTTLICDLPELFPQKDLPSSVHPVGPLFYHKVDADPLQRAEAQGLLSPTKKNILVSLGSTGDIEHFQWLCDQRFSDFRVIVSGRNAEQLKAPHCVARSFINHNVLLAEVDLMVCHGGNGTIYQALSYGVPVLACTNFFEQEYNMQRVTALGLGEDVAGIESRDLLEQKVRHWIALKMSPQHRRIQASIHDWLQRFGERPMV